MSDEPRTPELETLLEMVSEAARYGIRVMLPARVESYDATRHRCSVTPLIMDGEIREDGERRAKPLPTLHDVPVGFPGGSVIRIRWPLKKDDEVLLVFSSSSIARLKAAKVGKKKPIDPVDDRRHDHNDAVVWPACSIASPTDAAAVIEFTDSLIKCGGSQPLVTRAEFMAHKHDGVESGPSLSGTPSSSISGTLRLRG